MRNAANALRTLLKNLGMEGALRFGRIAGNWGTLFPGSLSQHTAADSLNVDVLTINVDSPAWLQQANFYRNMMLEKLRPYGVRSVRFRQGVVISPEPPIKPLPDREVSVQDRDDIDRMVSAITDEELKLSIRKAALRCLSKRRRDGVF